MKGILLGLLFVSPLKVSRAANYQRFAELLVLRGQTTDFSQTLNESSLYRRRTWFQLSSATDSMVNLYRATFVDLQRTATFFQSQSAHSKFMFGTSLYKLAPNARDLLPALTGWDALRLLTGGPAGVGKLACKHLLLAGVKSERLNEADDVEAADLLAEAVWSAHRNYRDPEGTTIYVVTYNDTELATNRILAP